jgi:hypothetical protein
MPLGYQPDNVGSSESHPQYIPGGHEYSVGDIFTYTDGGVTSAYIVQTAFTSTDFVSDSVNFTGIAGGDSTYTGTATIPVGGISSGTSFVNADLQTMMQTLLEPYQPPTFTSFSLSGYSILEVGDSIPSGAKTFLWATSQSANVEPNTIEIFDATGGDVSLGSGLANDGSESLSLASAITKTTNTSHTFRIEGENTQAGSFSRNYNVNWQYLRFYGKEGSAGPLTEAQIEGLPSSGLASTFAGTYSIPSGAGYVYFAFPTAWGSASGFKDTSTNLDVAMEAPYTVAVTNSFGVTHNYRVHRSTNQLNGAITIQVS